MAQQYQNAVAPTYRRRALCQIYVAGRDVTSALDPHLISVQVLLRDFGPDQANVELDDRDASLAIPQDKSPVKILLGWAGSGPELPLNRHVENVYRWLNPAKYAKGIPEEELPYRASGLQMVFIGQVTAVESGFARSGGGRRLWIECKSSSDKGTHKEPGLTTVGEGVPGDGDGGKDVSLTEFLGKVMGNHGLSLVATGIDDIKRKFWAQQNESPASLGQRLASEMGLGFKIIGNTAYITPREVLPNGEMAPTVEAKWGVNLISWRIKPFSGRAQWQGAKQQFFDIWNGIWKSTQKGIGGDTPFGDAPAIAGLPGAAPNSQAGEQTNAGMAWDSEENRGTGWVIVNGEPAAQPKGSIVISGARPGVDGRYKISEAEHNYTRGGGYITRCNLKKPELIGEDYYSWNINKMAEDEINRIVRESPFFPWGENTPPAIDPPPAGPPAPPISS